MSSCPSFHLWDILLFFPPGNSVNPVSSHPTDCAADRDSGGRARDGVILGKSMVGTLDEELVSEEDGKDICLLVVHTGNFSGDVLTWSFVDSKGVIDLTSPRSDGFS